MKNPVITLPPNTLGRDFVIGDLHGSLSCLVNLLANVDFDQGKDRLISVGDLVDRGPDSLSCLELLNEPWFHAVLSNHEQMMFEAFHGGWIGGYWLQNGGGWGAQALNDFHKGTPMSADGLKLLAALKKVGELPYLITVERPDGRKFHVIHAELPAGATPSDEDLTDPAKVLDLATFSTREGDYFLWGRALFLSFYNTPHHQPKIARAVAYKGRPQLATFRPELSHIISGHTPLQHPLTILGQTNIDTMAFASYFTEKESYATLTAVELGSWTFYQASETAFRIVEPTVVNRADIEEIWNGKATEGSSS